MNISFIDKAIAAYQETLSEDDKKRLQFFRGLWEQMSVWQTGPVTAAAHYTAPSQGEVHVAITTEQPILSVFTPHLSKERLRSIYRALSLYVCESDLYKKVDAQNAADVDLGNLLNGQLIELAETNPEVFLNTAYEILSTKSLSEKSLNLSVLLLMLSLRVELEPIAKKIAPLLPRDTEFKRKPLRCPVCGSLPALSKVGGEDSPTQGRGRLLYCQQCGTVWDFDRIRCARCGTRNQGHLHFFNIEGDDGHRLALCDECGGYIRTIFIEDTFVPFSFEVEEVVTARLDAIAHDSRFYQKAEDSKQGNR